MSAPSETPKFLVVAGIIVTVSLAALMVSLCALAIVKMWTVAF